MLPGPRHQLCVKDTPHALYLFSWYKHSGVVLLCCSFSGPQATSGLSRQPLGPVEQGHVVLSPWKPPIRLHSPPTTSVFQTVLASWPLNSRKPRPFCGLRTGPPPGRWDVCGHKRAGEGVENEGQGTDPLPSTRPRAGLDLPAQQGSCICKNASWPGHILRTPLHPS